MVRFKHLRAKLEHDRVQILERMELLRADSQDASETREGSPFGKREEEASETFEFEKRMVLERSLQATLAEIDHALEKFEAATYGRCESCGREIEHERLEARPQASLCMECKAQQLRNPTGAS
ncbi:MAG: TraR/DksA C4-type zinc finger protein [Chloroflexi bacterium]|nr:TraR/DksA C4-type zinc finger protein [Chloroflexota bacterium]